MCGPYQAESWDKECVCVDLTKVRDETECVCVDLTKVRWSVCVWTLPR